MPRTEPRVEFIGKEVDGKSIDDHTQDDESGKTAFFHETAEISEKNPKRDPKEKDRKKDEKFQFHL